MFAAVFAAIRQLIQNGGLCQVVTVSQLMQNGGLWLVVTQLRGAEIR
jgi:hypothetical protein